MTSPLKRVAAIFNYGNLEGDNRYKRRLVMFFFKLFQIKNFASYCIFQKRDGSPRLW